MSGELVKVLYVNGEGAGFADVVEVARGLPVEDFFKKHMAGAPAENYTIKVNRDITPPNYGLQDGDKITITPAKVGGSR